MKLLKTALPWGLLVIASVAAVVFAYLWQDASAQDRSEEEMRARAQDFVVALTNFGSNSIEADVEEIRSFATGTFAEEVDELFSDEVIARIKDAEATSEATVRKIFVQSLTDENASVFAVVTQRIMNTTLSEPESSIARMEIDLIKTSSGWKVEEVELFQSPDQNVLPG
jgi:hypothetical protein